MKQFKMGQPMFENVQNKGDDFIDYSHYTPEQIAKWRRDRRDALVVVNAMIQELEQIKMDINKNG